MHDEFIQSTCEQVFKQPTYIIERRTVTLATSIPTATFKFPRRTLEGSKQVEHHDEHFCCHEETNQYAEKFCNRKRYFDSLAAHICSCVVAS